jgi:hypothetical protein
VLAEAGSKQGMLIPVAVGLVLVGGYLIFANLGAQKKDPSVKEDQGAGAAQTSSPASAAPVTPRVATTPEEQKTARVVPNYPPVLPTASANRPPLPLESRLVSRYIASEHLLRYGDLDKLKSKAEEIPAAPGLAMSTWNDLVAAGGNRPLLARDRVLAHSPRMEVLTGAGLRGEIAVVAFNEGQFLRAVLPLDAEDKIHLDPATSGGNKPGHTLFLVVRPRAISDGRDNRLLTMRREVVDSASRTSYHLSHTRDHRLRMLMTVDGEDQAPAITTDVVPLGKLVVVTILLNQTEKSMRLSVQGADGFKTTSPPSVLAKDVPGVEELLIGTNPTFAGSAKPKDCVADIAELIIYRSALTAEMASKAEADLARHYFER